MEQELPQQPNKYITFIKNNKYNLYFAVAIVILLSMIIAMIVLTVNHKNAPSVNTTQNVNPSQAISPTVASVSEAPSSSDSQITIPDPTEAAQIVNQVRPQITPAISYTYSNIKKFGDSWATAEVSNPTTDGGGVIMQKVNGAWKIIEGPGTFFPPSLLQSDGAPQSLIDSYNPSSSPSPAP